MWEKVLPIIGGIFAGIGLILIFFDVIASIKRRDKTKINIAGLVILSVAVVGYTVTDLILKDSAWPPLASFLWIALFWVYVILDACITMGAIKKARKNKKSKSTASETQSNSNTVNDSEQQEETSLSDVKEQSQSKTARSTKKAKNKTRIKNETDFH